MPGIGQRVKKELEERTRGTLQVDLRQIHQDDYSCAAVSARAALYAKALTNPVRAPPLEAAELRGFLDAFGELKANRDDPSGRKLPTNFGVSDWCKKNGVLFEHRAANLLQTIARAPPSSDPLVGILFLALGYGGEERKGTGHFVAWSVPARFRALPPPRILPPSAPPPRFPSTITID
jgi:hypothetical protein